MPTVRCRTYLGERAVVVAEGSTLLGAVEKADLPIGQSCRGTGVCAMCEVTVLSGALRPPDDEERLLIARRAGPPSQRFACRARVAGDCCITTGYW